MNPSNNPSTKTNAQSHQVPDADDVWPLLSIFFAHVALWGLIIIVLALFAEPAAGEELELDEVSHGSLLFNGDTEGKYTAAPLLRTDVTLDVSGLIVRAKVRQSFKNNGDGWVEGIYVFPLPEDAAVDHMRMEIGERIIEGQIKERQAAKRVYEQARREGKKVSLIEQERPNLFTNSVANIGPHEDIVIEIEYQQVLRYDTGEFRLRFPLAITPRYIPGTALPQNEEVSRFSGDGWAMDTRQVPDASRITPPVWQGKEKINPVSLTMHLNAGFPIAGLESPYHAIVRDDSDVARGITTITLGDTKNGSDVFADRDFELRWRPAAGKAPRAALFREQIDTDNYYLLMVLPPQEDEQYEQILAREVTYIIDISGSMAGTSIRQAKQALQLALQRLPPGDLFNIIAFNSSTVQLFDHALPASQYNLKLAHTYVDSLEAHGGTEMYPALQAALQDQSGANVRQVIFLTDGSVGNEAALFKLIHEHLGDSRLFTIGIGSAPNSYFMRKAAEFGRGTFTYIGDVNEVQKQMMALFRKLENPVMTGIAIDYGNASMEMYPSRLPDLYHGEPLVVAFKSNPDNYRISLSGQRREQQWQSHIELARAVSGKGIGTLWARRKIAALMDAHHSGSEQNQIREQIINVALQHHLVSNYTSLVAVDVTPSRPGSEGLDSRAMPVNLPHGQVYEKIFGHHARTATTARLNLALGTLLLLASLLLQRTRKA